MIAFTFVSIPDVFILRVFMSLWFDLSQEGV